MLNFLNTKKDLNTKKYLPAEVTIRFIKLSRLFIVNCIELSYTKLSHINRSELSYKTRRNSTDTNKTL